MFRNFLYKSIPYLYPFSMAHLLSFIKSLWCLTGSSWQPPFLKHSGSRWLCGADLPHLFNADGMQDVKKAQVISCSTKHTSRVTRANSNQLYLSDQLLEKEPRSPQKPKKAKEIFLKLQILVLPSSMYHLHYVQGKDDCCY